MADAPKPDAKAAKYEPPKELESKAAVQKFMGRPKRQPVEQAEYFYNVKKTHIVMFVSSLLMLISFVLMFQKDYVRDWKDYQSEFAAMEFEKLVYDMHELEVQKKGHDAEIRNIDTQIDAFLALFRSAGEKGREFPVTQFKKDPDPSIIPELGKAPWNVVHVVVDEEKPNNWEKKLAIVEKETIRGDLYKKINLTFNFDKDTQGSVRYRYEEAKHRFEEAQKNGDPRLPKFEKHFREMEEEWKAIRDEVEKSKVDKDKLERQDGFYEDFRAALESRPIEGLWDKGKTPFEKLKKDREKLVKDLEDKKLRFEKEKPSPPNTIRNLPMADFFGPTLKIKQVILGDLKDQLNFIRIDKVDRCHTCHVGIGNPTYAVDYFPDAKEIADQVRFRDEFLREFVAHARGTKDGKPFEKKECKVCDPERRRNTEVKEPLTGHGSWSSDDAIRFTKTFMAHPRLDLFVNDSSKHPLAKFGCTVCHEGDGRDTDFSRVVHTPNSFKQAMDWKRRHGTPYGEEKYNWNYRELWDLPMFPSKFAQSSCRRCHADAVDLDGGEKYVQGMKVFERAGCYGCHRTETYQILKKDVENTQIDINRKTRRPGPPLERIAVKVTQDWVKKWVLEPRAFRPSTRMPHFFQLSNCRHEVNKNAYPPEVGRDGLRRSPVDDTIVTCLTEYIWSLSETTKDPDPPALKGDAKRGELLVQQVGCIGCHRIDDVAYDPSKKESRFLKEFAPTLRGVGSKMDRTWLYHWVRNPKKHFEQSAMGNLRLSEQEGMDVVEYLMSLKVKPEWEAKPAPTAKKEIVDDLIREQLKKSISDYETEMVLKGEHPLQTLKDEKKKDEQKIYDELATDDGKRRWLGRRMVKNFGCYSCHQLKDDATAIPKMEWQNEEGIGVELTGAQPFGSKHVDRLDFGLTEIDGVIGNHEGVNHHGVKFQHGFDGREVEEKIHETRMDWLAAKLRNPRMFDGGKMTSKPWDELLRMPWFDFSDHEIELLQTFVLSFTDHEPAGLVKVLVKRMNPDEVAMNRGNRVVRDHNCRACHRLSLDQFEMKWVRWEGEGDLKKRKETWETVEGRNLGRAAPEQTEKDLKDSGLLGREKFDEKEMESYSIAWASDHRTLERPKVINADNQKVARIGPRWWYLEKDADGKYIEIRRHLDMDGGEILPHVMAFKRALNKEYVTEKEKLDNRSDDLDGLIKDEKDAGKKKALQDEKKEIGKRLAAEFPLEKILDPNDDGQNEARLAPMLRTQGVKTQSDWLFKFLKKPYPIRPNLFPIQPGAKTLADVNLRMPTFEFMDEEANALVHWFAVRDQLPGKDFFPNTEIPEFQVQEIHKQVVSKIVLNADAGCAKCHYVNGKPPTSDPYANGPELTNVGSRLGKRWLLSWLNDPAAIYPKTTMTDYWGGLKKTDPKTAEAEMKAAVDGLLDLKKMISTNK